MYKKGDKVKVWSLQSFNNGGFLKGEPGIVHQDQIGDSVIVEVVRNFNGTYKVDYSYEVYDKQLERMSESEEILHFDSYTRARIELAGNNNAH